MKENDNPKLQKRVHDRKRQKKRDYRKNKQLTENDNPKLQKMVPVHDRTRQKKR